MKTLAKTTLVAALSISPLTANAEGLYSFHNLGVTSNDVQDNAFPEGKSFGLKAGTVVGYSFSNQMFVEGEGQFQLATPDTATNDSLSNGGRLGFRVGKNFGNASFEVLAGIAKSDTDEGSTERHYAGFGGGYAFNERLSFTALVGFLNGSRGTDDSGLDGLRETVHGSLGLHYMATDALRLDLNVALGNGKMDDTTPAHDMDFNQISLGVSYAFDNGMTVYGRASHLEMNQPPESDTAKETRFEFGLKWAFGATQSRPSRIRPDLPDYTDWMAISAGVLE